MKSTNQENSTMTIFINSDAFIGIESKDDAHHEITISLLRKLSTQSVKLYTSWGVVQEVATKLSHFLSKEQSLSFLKSLDAYQIKVLYPTPEIAKETRRLFSDIKIKRVSFTNCANIVYAQKLQIDYVFSFDKIYQKQGLQLISEVS